MHLPSRSELCMQAIAVIASAIVSNLTRHIYLTAVFKTLTA